MKRVAGWTAVLCLLAGLAVLALGSYKALDPFAEARQRQAQSNLYHSWSQPVLMPNVHHSCAMPGRPIPVGRYFAIIRIPAFGKHWRFTVIQGTSLTQLATGPGHIPGTALPGRAGNVGIAAHDVTAGNPFLHLANLRPGDKIIIETRTCTVVYRVYRPSYRVWYTDTHVLRPAVGRPRILTLITCWPTEVLYFVPHRTIIQAEQINSHRR